MSDRQAISTYKVFVDKTLDFIVRLARQVFRNTRVQQWPITEKIYSIVMAVRTNSKNESDFLVEFKGSKFFFESGDITILPTLISGDYEKEEIKRLLDFAKNSEMNYRLIDIGANVGVYSILFAKEATQHSNQNVSSQITGNVVFAFEPDPRNLERFYRNIDLNLSSRDLVKILEVAVSDQVGKKDFKLSRFGGTSRIANSESESNFQVEVTTIDQFCKEHIEPNEKIVLKIDTEGYESSVLRGALTFIKANLPVIFLEIFPNSSNLDLELMKEIIPLYNCAEYISGNQSKTFETSMIDELQELRTYGNLILHNK